MPELAEVEYMRRRWDPALGQTVRSVRLHRDARVFRGVDLNLMARSMRGSVFQASESRGKQMLLRFEPGGSVGLHLGMTGALRTEAAAHRAERHEHLVLVMDTVALVFEDPRLFGRIRFDAGVAVPDWWRLLPPRLESSGFLPADLDHFLNRRKGSPLKAVLLMQERFPGIGNWMADEILWRSRLHPGRLAGSLEPAERTRLYREIRTVVRVALETIARPGEHWGDPPEDWLFHRRWADGGLCPRTGAVLQRETIGGRTTCWSPSWQN